MSETKFTPGPWILDMRLSDDEYLIINMENRDGVLKLEKHVAGHDEADLPNAHLISSAPEMFQVLEDVLDALTDGGRREFTEDQNDYHVGAIKRVLKKALNEEPK